MYKTKVNIFKAPVKRQPAIIFVDNDSGFTKLFHYIKNVNKNNFDRNLNFYHIIDNLYVVTTPLKEDKNTTIEDFLTDDLKKTELEGKFYNPNPKTFDKEKNYGKSYLAF